MTKTHATNTAVASEYMQRDVVTVSPDDSLRDALALMTENHVTGLPVMDGGNRCVGLITSSDILNYEADRVEGAAAGETAEFFDPESQQWVSVPISALGLEEIGDVAVREVMATNLVWVERSTPVGQVARKMIDEGIHRVLVMDDRARLYGILSAFDFVRLASEK
ncbi:MAG: CBS domain-containing protein [Pirellulales bacterium]|nr:CBS domain-containing protein [Pirellulales bacterium]